MILAVGHGCNPPESEFNHPLHVRFRKSQVWDPVEGSFAEPLTTTTMSASKIMDLYMPSNIFASFINPRRLLPGFPVSET
jgi:hypothetical protein